MKHIKTILIALILTAVINIIIVPYQAANAGVADFKTSLIAAFTANFTAPQRQRIANSFTTAYAGEWQARLDSGVTDNAANRGSFAADKIIAYVNDVVVSEDYKAGVRAVPTPSPLEP